MRTTKDKFVYQLSNWLPYEGLDSVVQTLKEGGGVVEIDYVIKKSPRGLGFAVYTLGKGLIKYSSSEKEE